MSVRPHTEGEAKEGRACLQAMPACAPVVCIHMHVISGNFTAGRRRDGPTHSLLFSYILRSFVSPRGATLPPFLINSQRDPGVISCLGCFDLTERRRRRVYTPHWQKTRQGREKWESVNASEQRDD